jgi:hypothetical protein
MPCFTLRVPYLGGKESCGYFQGRLLFLPHSFLQRMVIFFFRHSAIEGTMNIVGPTHQAGIKMIVVTS